MSCPIRFQQGQRWAFNQIELIFERELADRGLHFMVERSLSPFQVEDDAGHLTAPDWDWAIRALAEGTLRRRPSPEGRHAARRAAALREDAPEDIAALDGWAQVRRFVLRGLDDLGFVGLGEARIAAALDHLWELKTTSASELPRPAARTVRRWLRERGTPGDRPLRQMMSMEGRVPRRGRLEPLVRDRVTKAALQYWASPRTHISDAYAIMASEMWDLNEARGASEPPQPPLVTPSRETLRKAIRDLECRDTYAAKWGQTKADSRFKGDGEGVHASRFLQLGMMDHTWFDAVAVFDDSSSLPLGRPTLTVIIDVYTRCIVAFVLSFEPPSMFQALECVIRANRPKVELLDRCPDFPVLAHIFGRFDEIVVDNGWEFSGKSFEDAMGDAGTSVRWAPIKSPTYKAIVERFFGTLNGLIRKAPGGVLKPELLRELGHDPHKDAVFTLLEFQDLIWDALNLYHIDVHSGSGRPPADLWQEEMQAYGIDVIGDDRQLEKMAGQMKYPCTLSRSGVRSFGLQFHAADVTENLLADLIGGSPVRGQRKGSATAKVKIKFNPANLAQIHVWNERRKTYVTLPCTDERYAQGVSLWQHQRLREWTQVRGLEFSTEQDRLKARAALIAKIEHLAPELKIRQRRAIARMQESPFVQERLTGRGVSIAFAPSRHDGMAPVIPHETLASIREDGSAPPTRPPRGGVAKRQRKSVTSKAQVKRERLSHDLPESEADGDDQIWGEFE